MKIDQWILSIQKKKEEIMIKGRFSEKYKLIINQCIHSETTEEERDIKDKVMTNNFTNVKTISLSKKLNEF